MRPPSPSTSSSSTEFRRRRRPSVGPSLPRARATSSSSSSSSSTSQTTIFVPPSLESNRTPHHSLLSLSLLSFFPEAQEGICRFLPSLPQKGPKKCLKMGEFLSFLLSLRCPKTFSREALLLLHSGFGGAMNLALVFARKLPSPPTFTACGKGGQRMTRVWFFSCYGDKISKSVKRLPI